MSNIPLGLFSLVFWWVSVYKAIGWSCLNHETAEKCRWIRKAEGQPAASSGHSPWHDVWRPGSRVTSGSQIDLIPFKLFSIFQVGKINQSSHHSWQVWGFCFRSSDLEPSGKNFRVEKIIPPWSHHSWMDFQKGDIDSRPASLQRDFRTCSTRLSWK